MKSEEKEIDQGLFERIEHYLDERMDMEERTAFELKMKADRELRAEVEIMRELRDAIELGGVRDKIEAIHAREFPVSHEGKGNSWNRWKIAATVLVILGIGALLSQHSTAEEKLFAEYVTSDPGLPVTMGANAEYAFADGMVSYKQGQYQNALSTWESINSEGEASDKLTFYQGCAHFNLEEYEPVLSYLADLVDNPQSDFHDKAVWYTCLSYLQLNEVQKIRSLSPREISPYYDRVEAIKQELSE